MQLSVSNIAWNNKYLEKYLQILQELNCHGVEIAPSAIWDEPTNASDEEITYIKKLIKKYNLVIPAFHALLYNKPNFSIFGNKNQRKETVSYIKKLIQLADKLSVNNLVYGSPNSRKLGEKTYTECYNIAIETFKDLAKECRKHNTCFCIEPLESFKNDFIQNSKEGHRIVTDVNDSGFRLHLDTGAMINNKEDFNIIFKKYVSILRHFHVNDPGLMPPGHSNIDHSIISKPLVESKYNNFISIEMRKNNKNNKNNMNILKKSILYVKEKYYI